MSFFQHIAVGTGTTAKSRIPRREPKSAIADKNSSFIKELAPITNKSNNRTNRVKADALRRSDKTLIDIDIIGTTDDGTPDILFVDERIKTDLANKRSAIPGLYKRIGHLRWIINNSDDQVDRIQARDELLVTNNRIQDIEHGFDYSLYILRTADILDEYRSLLEATKTTSFIKIYTSRDETKIYKRNKLMLDYIRVAKEYINLDNYRQKITKPACENCHSTKLKSVGDGDSMLVCECGATLEQLDDAPTFKDSERVNMSSRYTYTCRGHFIEAMNRFEGKQNTEIDESIVKMLQKEVALHRLTAETASKDHIHMFMTEKKLSDYYADINLIYFKITAKNPPDITAYRNELLEMHDQLEEAYLEVKDEDRLNSLNVNWKLYKLLQLLGYECKKDDFFCLKTPTKQGEHEQKWYDMIECLKRKYPNVYSSHGHKRWRHITTL